MKNLVMVIIYALTVVYEALGYWSEALDEYTQAMAWREALPVSAKCDLSASASETLYTTLAEGLVDDRKFRDAAVIYDEYLLQPHTAIKLLCQEHNFEHAKRIVGQFD